MRPEAIVYEKISEYDAVLTKLLNEIFSIEDSSTYEAMDENKCVNMDSTSSKLGI